MLNKDQIIFNEFQNKLILWDIDRSPQALQKMEQILKEFELANQELEHK